jgi:peptide chain release factor 2
VVSQRLSRYEGLVRGVDRLDRQIEDAEVLLELAAEADDADSPSGGDRAQLGRSPTGSRVELESLFFDEYDEADAILSVHAGAGGVDAQDWAEMLARMYQRFLSRPGLLGDRRRGDRGRRGGGQVGHHDGQGRPRLRDARVRARRPPAGADQPLRRQRPPAHQLRRCGRHPRPRARTPTSRSTKTTSASTPTDPRVPGASTSTPPTRRCGSPTCPPGRRPVPERAKPSFRTRRGPWRCSGREAGRATRLEREEHLDRDQGEKGEAAWGRQVRSYVLQPYQMVKDLRTDHEVGNVQGVLDGDLRRVRRGLSAMAEIQI